MATFSKLHLSGSTNGQPILVAATSGTGTTIHTAVTGTSSLDEIWLYAHNTSSSSVKLTLQWGGTTAPNNDIEITIGAEGTGAVLIAPGWLLNNGLLVRAFAGTTNVINIIGYVNRIS
jgi:hypothetical protein